MKESVTYQMMTAESRAEGRVQGALEEAKRILLRLGHIQYGPAPAQAGAAIEAIMDLARLEQLSERVLTATSWQELLDLPAPSRPRRRKS